MKVAYPKRLRLEGVYVTISTLPRSLGGGQPLSYMLEGGVLTLFWQREEVVRQSSVKPGDGFIVSCDGKKFSLKPITLPKGANGLAWLFAFDKQARARDAHEFDELVEKCRHEYRYVTAYKEIHVEGDGFHFVFANDGQFTTPKRVAAYISKPLAAEAVRDAILGCYQAAPGALRGIPDTMRQICRRLSLSDEQTESVINGIYNM